MINSEHNGLVIGMNAPQFQAQTTFGPTSLENYNGRWLVFFSHPADFTPVCTTEFLAFAQAFPYFQALNTDLLGLSIDSNTSHLAWVYAIYSTTGITIPFPIIADPMGIVAKQYGMFMQGNDTQTVRSVFIIDPTQKIRAILNYPMTNGRNTYEILRLVEALQLTDREGVVTPANWTTEQPPMVPAPTTYQGLLERASNPSNLVCHDWFWCYKNEQDTIQPK